MWISFVSILLMSAIYFAVGVWTMANTVLLAIVVAEIVRFGAEIVHHRRHF